MKLTKQKIWFIIQIAMAAFLIINGCLAQDKPYEKDKLTLNKTQRPVFNSAINTISFTKISFNNIP